MAQSTGPRKMAMKRLRRWFIYDDVFKYMKLPEIVCVLHGNLLIITQKGANFFFSKYGKT